jgi:hypothetical protein
VAVAALRLVLVDRQSAADDDGRAAVGAVEAVEGHGQRDRQPMEAGQQFAPVRLSGTDTVLVWPAGIEKLTEPTTTRLERTRFWRLRALSPRILPPGTLSFSVVVSVAVTVQSWPAGAWQLAFNDAPFGVAFGWPTSDSFGGGEFGGAGSAGSAGTLTDALVALAEPPRLDAVARQATWWPVSAAVTV